MLIDFLKSNLFVQNLISWIFTKIPFVLEHNLGKYLALKKAFYLTALDNVDRDYLEFGVFTGSSFICALRTHRNLSYIGNIETNFYGFDSFEGFGKIKEHDKHLFYIDRIFKVDSKKIINEIHKRAKGLNVKIVKGYFDETIKNKNCKKDFNINKIRCMLIDCDLKDATKIALEFSRDSLQQGTVIILDDFYSFKGASNKGVAGAFNEFCQDNPGLQFRKIFDYGYGGAAYILSEIK
jgi:hypothetical protein